MSEQKAPIPTLADWEDHSVQRIYEILCDDLDAKPIEEHHEGYCARWIVGEIVAPLSERISKLEAQLAEDNRAKTENARTMAPAQALSFYELNRLNAKVSSLAAELAKAHGMLDKCFAAFPDDSCATCREHSLPWRIAKLDELHENQLAEAHKTEPPMGRII